MVARFWGVRGSIAWSTPDSIRHGCNTPCVEVADGRRDSVLVLDAGSGIVGLGHALEPHRLDIHILLTHYHWDHVLGLPLFSPLYSAGSRVHIWAPKLGSADAAWIEQLFAPPFFPLPFGDLPSTPTIDFVDDEVRSVGGFAVRAMRLHHPGGSFAYRVAGDAGDLLYATDHEFGSASHDERLAAFAAGASAAIMDAHFTPEELALSAGRGHGSWAQCCELAAAQRIGRLWLFHHKPGRSDPELDAIQNSARAIFEGTFTAAEGAGLEF